uniref:tRNA-dihydrouridine(16/17) synthase [NAD(P)(+)] n=1 Tax=Culicoides sonorensis TaxID=179676 RepID=A0A336LPQ5_CULSO
MTQSFDIDPIEKEPAKNSESQPEWPIPVGLRPKLSGWDFYNKTLGSPKYVLAPMVDASEAAWRMLARNHSAELCYSPMWHSGCFINDPKYRKNALQSCPGDRPLIIQFCGNDPEKFLEAGLLAQDHCDAIDINLGCPQSIASRGKYGAFLQDNWKLIENIVSTLHHGLAVPVTCKIRVFPSLEKTIQYAQMLEKAGAQLLTVHGRTREQKGENTGLANWDYIKAVVENVKIPVFANGNIQSVEDVHRCIEETGCAGVMTAEGHLYNPAIFDGINPLCWDMATEYLDIVEKYEPPKGYTRGHLFKIFHHLIQTNEIDTAERILLAEANSLEEFRNWVAHVKEKFIKYHTGQELWKSWKELEENTEPSYDLKLPPWICQPYVRPSAEKRAKLLEARKIEKESETEKRKYFDEEGNEISRKKSKKLEKKQKRKAGKVTQEKPTNICTNEKCNNLMGNKCDKNKLCRACCKEKCGLELLDCPGHKIFIKTNRLHKAKINNITPC